MLVEKLDKTSGRIEVIDVLRGFALLGIILVHMTEQYYAGQLPEQHANFTSPGTIDQIVMGIVGIFITGKFYMIFSFLFGLSFYLQLSKSNGSVRFLMRFFWRLLILFGIGFIHHLHYRGDILTIYALLGLVLLLAYRLPDKYLLILAILLVLDAPAFLIRLKDVIMVPNAQNPFSNADQNSLLAYYNTVKSGTYLEILKANLAEFSFKIDFQILSGRLYITMGLFLLGLYAGRKNIFKNIELKKPFFKRLIKGSLWVLLGCILFSMAFFGGAQALGIKVSDQLQWMVGGEVYDIFNAVFATIYTSGLLLLFQKEKWRPRLMNFYAVGRMGLTTYLVQTVFGVLIFFSVGLGLLGEMGAALTFSMAIGLYIIQILFSKFWLAHFEYGFFEWLWRSLTDLKVQPFRK
ncbi:MAG: DUF418 domain-containing protein [Bacteroidota bacterium]